MFHKFLKKLSYFKFIFTKSADFLFFSSLEPKDLLLITIAYNNSEFVKYQILLLKKYLKDDFFHCIVDNSSDVEEKDKIKNQCLSHSISYYSVPNNPYKNTKSHGAAMHWSYFQLIKKSSYRYFGFLDHDIFPTADFSIMSKLNQGFYGRVIHAYHKNGYQKVISKEAPYWSLWAGYCFFESNIIKANFPWVFNFFSRHFPGGYFLDTGGGLWDHLYSKLDYPSHSASFEEIEIDKLSGNVNQQERFEILDKYWIHFVSLSNWRSIRDLDFKKKKLIELLNAYI